MAALTALPLLMLASSADAAQSAAPTAPIATPAPTPDAGLHDRVLALVQTRKCSAAHDEAVKGGDELLAQQVSELCGLKPTRDGGGSKSRKAPGGSGAPGGPGSLGRRGG